VRVSETWTSQSAVDRMCALIFGRNDSSFVQLFRYTLVGGIAFASDFGTLFALTSLLHVHYLVSAAAAYVVGLTLNYSLSVAWVFSHRSKPSHIVEFTVFAGVGFVGLGLNELIMWFFTGALGFFYLFSKLISAVVVYLFNFGARKTLLFR